MRNDSYLKIVAHYKSCFDRHGGTHLGVDWPDPPDVAIRYQVMLDVVENPKVDCSRIDFGCGTSHLYEFLRMSYLPEHRRFEGRPVDAFEEGQQLYLPDD